jgi:signal peptidase II
MPTDRSVRHAFGLAAFVLVADIATKCTIVALLELGEQQVWLPVLNIVHVLNRGAAFSFLHDADGWQRGFFIAVALAASVFLTFMIRRADTSVIERLSFGLILGGALGNAFDRIVRGAVVDWIDFHWGAAHFPAFNAADIGISIGAALMVIDVILGSVKRRAHG